MTSRRQFLHTLVAAAATPSCISHGGKNRDFGRLTADKAGIIDLPEGFRYRVIARAGSEMSDGLLVPHLADGMAAFPGRDGNVNIVCNHEIVPSHQHLGPFGGSVDRLSRIARDRIYDDGNGTTPGAGGTTTIVYNPVSGETERQFLSLAGTELNCAGGATPWGSWLSCEETFSDPGPALEMDVAVDRSRRHGYVFEVPALADGVVDPRPLTAMGRFEHEAAAVDPASGVIYLTEDRHRSLLYRFVPDVPGELARGGQLQALAVRDHDGFDTRNWSDTYRLEPGVWLTTRWIDVVDADGDANDLRLRGYEAGAARFARGEGLCFADGSAFITCTIGGPERLGQVFEYRVSPHEGGEREVTAPGRLRLLAESTQDSVLRNADNITMSPWGDLIVCEDTANHCGLVGIAADGRQYALADNAYSDSELAGICFAPDGRTMFVNIQVPGLTLAITGPW